MIMVLAIWWFYDKFSKLLDTPQIEVFLHNLKAGDPCFLDGTYIAERQQMLSNLCNKLIPLLEQEFGMAVNTTTNILDAVKIFVTTDCACPFPQENLVVMNKEALGQAEMSEIGFTRTIEGVDAHLPAEDISWLGVKTICEDTEMYVVVRSTYAPHFIETYLSTSLTLSYRSVAFQGAADCSTSA